MKPLFLQLPKHPFDYTYMIDFLDGYRSPRSKIGSMMRKGEIIRVKKGLYILSSEYGVVLNKITLSNLIYGPSYPSLEYALSYWGLIPEKVEEVTCITNKRNKRFRTPLGVFSYRYLNSAAYSVGLHWVENQENSFIIASKEKALCDKLAMTIKNFQDKEELLDYLEFDLRIDLDELGRFSLDLLQMIEQRYKKRSVTQLVQWYFQLR